MSWFRPRRSKTLSPPPKPSPQPELTEPQKQEITEQQPQNIKHEVLLRIPGCKVHLMDEGEALELASGDFSLIRISDDSNCLATTIKVGEYLQWPLTTDEPVVKLDALHYLFSLPVKDGDPLSYGVSFLEQNNGGSALGSLDRFLGEHSCFSFSQSSKTSTSDNNDIDWKEFAPRVLDYNSVLSKAIAGGTGQIVKGIFMCSNAYTNQVQKMGETILSHEVDQKKNGVSMTDGDSEKGSGSSAKKSQVNKTLKRVRELSKMTEKMSKAMLDEVGIATGSVMAPVVRSQAGKAILSMVPGEVLLASLDAVNKVLDAAEAAEKQALAATSSAATRMVSQRFGESAGEATSDVLATAEHCAGTAWNIFKLRKAITPASSVSSGVLKNAPTTSKR